ncbi:CYTH domain-containing protein [Costertonia aggregata]|uniref:CYTH domain-containing protein n=1 Tax=Costertonia aggregata TaxID=343403 RepID=A0A7H9APZ5_9FLAO|nr:CYTH domain-containing protein [Costertonia aggregata]QLG45494.1 CYTH domain-containing protein [Costertonia aggregata]
MIEIERKFLVKSEAYQAVATSKTRIAQGFLNTEAERTVRVRIKDNQGFITVKGKSNATGTSRFEWEKEISFSEATDLIDLCKPVILEKIRYEVPFANHLFEVDRFLGENKGLVIAEVELAHEDEHFEKPQWLGKEVTGDVRYYNSQLSKKPFAEW